jgi:hypothetical protein
MQTGRAGMPRWVKWFIMAAAAALVLVAALMIGGHGPWQHLGMAGMH